MRVDPDYIARFKADLISLSSEEIFERYILSGTCIGIRDIDERALRTRIAERFETTLANVIIVGSAKLGFTLRRKRATSEDAERPPFSAFTDDSDVDIAIVSDALFDRIWKRCFEFWHSSGYGNSATGYWPRGKHFRDYIFRGWMRPDHLPSEGAFTYKADWFNFFRQLTSERAAGDYKVSAAVYREDYFLRAYQQIAINECRMEVVAQL